MLNVKLENTEQAEEIFRVSERISFNKVIRNRKFLKDVLFEQSSDGGSGSGAITRNELERQFLEQRDNYEDVVGKLSNIQSLITEVRDKSGIMGNDSKRRKRMSRRGSSQAWWW